MGYCAACNLNILVTQKRIKCTISSCGQQYHQDCVKYTNDSPALRSKWICPACVSSRPKGGDNSDTPVHVKAQKSMEKTRGGESLPMSSAAAEFESHLVPVETVRELLKSEINAMKKDFEIMFKKYICDELNSLKTEIQEIKTSISFVSSNYDDLSKRMDSMENRLKPLNSTRSEIKDINTSVLKLECDLKSREQWARRANIEILGIPEKKGENLINIFRKIAERAEFPINPDTDIDFVTRVAPKNRDSKKSKPIIVRFIARHKKDDCLSRLKKLKDIKACDLGYEGSNSSVYFNDHLTSDNKALLQETKKLVKEHNYKYIWVKHCCILARRDDTSPVLHISTGKDLKKIV